MVGDEESRVDSRGRDDDLEVQHAWSGMRFAVHGNRHVINWLVQTDLFETGFNERRS